MSAAEDMLALHLRTVGIDFVREYRFGAEACGGAGKGLRARLKDAGLQDWRFDFAIPAHKLAIEVEGGGWMKKSRHTSGTGFHGDLLKYEAAIRLGWVVYRCDPAMVSSGRALETISILLRQWNAELQK